GTCDETITVATLEMGYALACGLSSKTEEVRSLKSVRALPRGKSRVSSNQPQSPSVSPVSRVDSTGDITKPQHPEFAKQLIDILGIVDLHDQIEDTDLFQRAGKSDNPFEYLRRNGALLDDPLQHFAC
ncbi:ATP-binding protein, partial [Vibrio parahaemolyticus]|nr:ATP-binding protein [Vibrio parahaemolyticus]